jgi:chromate transporter
MMEDEFVRRRRWLSHQQFLDMLGATNLIPGPNSTEMAIHIGHQRAGWKGLVLGGVCFIAPAMAIVMAAAWVYVRFGSLPPVQSVMYGIKPVIIAVVLQALWRLFPSAIKSGFFGLIGLLAAAAALFGVNVLIVLFGAGVITAAASRVNRPRSERALAAIPAVKGILPALKAAGVAAPAAAFSLTGLFLFFLKVGALLYGSGYVLLAFLQADLVDRLHWLTQSQLLDAIAVGQVTPGPVFTTATFIGYLLGGTIWSVVATVGIFVPSFVLVAASRPLIPRIRSSPIAGAFLDGVNVGALALMAAVTLQLSRAALVDIPTVLIGAISALLLLYRRINSAWLILAAGLIGLAASRW